MEMIARAEPVIHGIDIMREKKDTMLVGSGSVFQTMNSTVTMNLATIFKLRGINLTVSAACASGSHAIGTGLSFYKKRFAGMHHLRWSTGNKQIFDGQF